MDFWAVVLILLLAGCSSDSSGGAVNGNSADDPDTPAVVDTVRAPLYVYEILAERTALDSSEVGILDLLSEPRVEQLLMNHVDENVALVQAKKETLAAFGIDSAQFTMDSAA